jgi:hypothetical protein
MSIAVAFDLSREFEVKAGAAEVFGVPADVPPRPAISPRSTSWSTWTSTAAAVSCSALAARRSTSRSTTPRPTWPTGRSSRSAGLQAEPPAADKRANWLPVKPGEPFVLNARLYCPLPEALDGR